MEFTVADGCERTFSLAVYPLLGGEFSFEEQQELIAMATDAFGPGTHELTVEVGLGTGCPQASNGYEQLAKLTAGDTDAGDFFGRSVAVSDPGDTVVVGAYGNTEAGVRTGSTYVFGRIDGTWAQWTKLTAADVAPDDGSGPSVGVSDSGDTVVVGAFSYDDGTGSAYVFDRMDGTWTQRAKLTTDNVTPDGWFGSSVEVSSSGDTAVISAYSENAVGSASVFGRGDDGWTQRTNLTPDDGAEGDAFGGSIAVSDPGDTIVIGALYNDGLGDDAGSAYVFGR